MNDLISRQALCEYALNQKDKSITPNDIMRFPSSQPEWIPVSEVMPDEHDMVLILTDDGTIFIGDHNEYWEDDYEFEIDDVIAWMPLPEPWEGEKK